MDSSTNPSPPLISLTTLASTPMANQSSNLSNHGSSGSTLPAITIGSRNRSRAGTLPSTLLSATLPLPPSAAASNSSATSPLMSLSHPEPDFFETNPLHARRQRSGSLFLTNSIWNDDNISSQSHSLLDNSTPSSFISPTLAAQPSNLVLNPTVDEVDYAQAALAGRNRSYTTNGADSRVYIPANSDINSLLDNLMTNMSQSPQRNRAQTYAGVPGMDPPVVMPVQPQSQQQPSYAAPPMLLDDTDILLLIVSNNFENPNLGPTSYLLFDNLPVFFNLSKLLNALNNSFGFNARNGANILSIRTTSTSSSKLALVSCASVEIAMGLKATFNHFEIVPGIILYVAFAKCNELAGLDESLGPAPASQAPVAPVDTPVVPTNLLQIQDRLLATVRLVLGRDEQKVDTNKIVSIINKSLGYANSNYQDNFGPLPDPIPIRQFDAPKLRELRKDLEFNELLVMNGQTLPEVSGKSNGDNRIMSQLELEELCLAMLDELPELCYDYIGNTVVQKLFLLVKSRVIKLMMVKEITPYLTQLSIHKNGTWAIQKIINLCRNDLQQECLIADSLKPYTVKLFNDQFGNYVLQGCIKFKSPYNDFIFESILDNFIEISFGRFGSRSIRTILETADDKFISKEQIVLVSSLIVEHANELVVNNNGSLLITWFLDTFNGVDSRFDKKYELLTSKFIDNLQMLCSHKLANLTILKILNNRQDLRLKQVIMDKIFGKFEDGEDTKPPSRLLEAILTENPDTNLNAGPLFIYKVLSNPLLLNLTNYSSNNDEKDLGKNSRYQKFVVQQIRRLLLELSITNYQPYKKLMDEVGLSNTRVNRSSSMSKRGKRPGRNVNSVSEPHYNYNSQPQQNLQQNQPQPTSQPLQQNQPPQIMPGLAPAAYGYGYPMMTPQMMMNYQYPTSKPSNQQDFAMMQQLEQLSLSSAAMGYNSNPGTPGDARTLQNLFF